MASGNITITIDDLAQSVLRRFTARSPLDIKKEPFDVDIGICPECKTGVNAEFNFCPMCGQFLDCGCECGAKDDGNEEDCC